MEILMNTVEEKLKRAQKLITKNISTEEMLEILKIIGVGMTADEIESYRLWGDYMPLGDEHPYTKSERYLHILWELIDKVPLGINCTFAIPFRQAIAKNLFKKCGEGFVAAEGCRFNYGHQIEVGDNVSWNMGCYVDSKGGVSFGDFAMLTEYVKIFSHGHSEGNHMERDYKRVVIKDFAKLYTNCTILPGITIGTGAIVATGSIVTKDVDDYVLVSGIPARPMRKRALESTNPDDYNQYMMKNKLFQK